MSQSSDSDASSLDSSSMSKTPPTTASSSKFKGIFEKALKAYQQTTKQDLTIHPLASQLQECNSPAAILTMLQGQVDQFIQSRSGDDRLKNWLNPTISVLYAFSTTLSAGVGLVNINLSVADIALISIRQVFPPTNAIFAGAGVLLLVSSVVHLLVRALLTPGAHRRPRMSKQAKMSLLMSSNASKISFEGLKFTPMSHQLQQ
jgi:hypothetical protein